MCSLLYNVSNQQLLDEIKNRLDRRQRIIDNLRKTNTYLRGEHYKDELVADLKEQLTEIKKDMHRGFSISEEEDDAICKWIEHHNQEVHHGQPAGALGGRYTYCFCPTSIGVIGTIRCNCGDGFCFRELD